MARSKFNSLDADCEALPRIAPDDIDAGRRDHARHRALPWASRAWRRRSALRPSAVRRLLPYQTTATATKVTPSFEVAGGLAWRTRSIPMIGSKTRGPSESPSSPGAR